MTTKRKPKPISTPVTPRVPASAKPASPTLSIEARVEVLASVVDRLAAMQAGLKLLDAMHEWLWRAQAKIDGDIAILQSHDASS